jgi:predicted HicB family RNase H-like nuclease
MEGRSGILEMRIDPALKRRLIVAAQRKGLSTSAWVRLAITEALREQAAEAKRRNATG